MSLHAANRDNSMSDFAMTSPTNLFFCVVHHLFRHITVFFPSEIYCRLQTATKKSNLWKQDSQAVTSSPFKILMFRCLLAIINMLNLDALRLEDALIVLSLKNDSPNSKIWKEKISRYVIKQMLWQEQKKTSYPNPINMQRGNLVISLRCERAWYQH